MALGRVVLLDALGTLVELQPPAPLLAARLREGGVDVGEDEAARAIGAEIAYYREHHDEAVDAAALSQLRDRCTEVLRRALPGAARGIGHAELRDALLGALRFRAYPEVPGALADLRARGHALVVVSNWDVSLHETLERTGLRALVDGAVSSAEAGAAKPAPAIFARALALADA
ncbi:MAG: hydrolase, partial [Solirubrobacterales bacterium]|nr:hydrolase [Solirubrobacterales bacterium]